MSGLFQLVSLNSRYSHSCLALFYVRHALESHFPKVRADIIQFTINDPYYDTLLRLSAGGAEVLFFSVYIWNASYVERLVNDLAVLEPGRLIILGGPQAPYLETVPQSCTVVTGEIEGIDETFYRDLENRQLKPLYRGGEGNSYPFPYRDEDFTALLANRLVYYESSRGCPFRCSYCLSALGRKVFHKDIETVKDELGRILAHKPAIIKFVDRTFNDDLDRALDIWRFLAEQSGHTRFHFEISPDRFTKEMFDFLETVRPGRFQFEIGVQSTSPETLAGVNRRMDIESAEKNIRRLVAMDNIHLHVDLILGLPFETPTSFRESFDRVFTLAPQYIQMGLLKVLPDTPIFSRAEEHQLVFCGHPPYEILSNRWLDHAALSSLYFFCECVEAFYNNRYFETLWRYVRRQGEEPSSFFEGLLQVCRENDFFVFSHTQELLARMLYVFAGTRKDTQLVRELLRFDWLRCGHRFLPPFLADRSLSDLRQDLRRVLPQSMAGLFDTRGRSGFLKRAVFLDMSADALVQAGFETKKKSVVCFLPEQTGGVLKHCRVVLLGEVL